jgi:hypothetical protein
METKHPRDGGDDKLSKTYKEKLMKSDVEKRINAEVNKLVTKHGQYIVEILEKEYKDLDKNYTWSIPDIDDKKLFSDIDKDQIISKKNDFEKNVLLKDILSKKIGKAYDKQKLKHYEWIIQKWGRIGSKKNLDDFESFIKNLKANKISTKTISSYSKIVSFMEPDKYFILDSRVTYSLNWILFKIREENQLYFPVLQGRNSEIGKYDMNTILSLFYKKRKNKEIYYKTKDAYIIYCEFIKEVSKKCNLEIQKKPYYMEMILFSMLKRQ